MSNKPPQLTTDEWLGEMLGRPAYQLLMDDDSAMPPLESLSDGGPIFIWAKIPTTYIEAIERVSLTPGFRLVDTNVILHINIQKTRDARMARRVRLAEPREADDVAELARRSFICSRFHLDPEIPNSLADRMKSEWARNFFNGRRGDRMIVAVRDDSVIGFLQLITAPPIAMIDLIAVDAPYRRQGIAGEMIRYAMDIAAGCDEMRAGTQIANTASLRLYENLGFRTASASYVFHYHRGPILG